MEQGMKEYGLPFSGEVGFAQVDMYWAINHEVVPADQALRCADCHDAEAVTCTRCHGETEGEDPEELIGPNYTSGPRYWSRFEDFGYDEDPAIGGGRFRDRPMPGTVPRQDIE